MLSPLPADMSCLATPALLICLALGRSGVACHVNPVHSNCQEIESHRVMSWIMGILERL